MWRLWQKAKTYSKLPSEVFGETDSIAAWMLDNAVTWFGITIENALDERVKVGTKLVPKYHLTRLLDDNFKLPRPYVPPKVKSELNPWLPFLSWAGKRNSGVKRYEYRKTVD